jgi:hypothetical protein
VGACNYPTATQIYMGYVSFVWTFDQIRKQLLPHRHTLQELRIRLIGPTQEGLARFDIHAFDKLHTLQLCAINVPCPEKACDLWLTPNLKRLALEHSHMCTSTGNWGYCESHDVAWHAAFAQIAADRREAGNSGLRTLELICDTRLDEKTWPMSSGYLRAYEAEIPKKEAHIAKVREIVESFGFEFVRRREPCIGKGDRELCIGKGDREIVWM